MESTQKMENISSLRRRFQLIEKQELKELTTAMMRCTLN